MSVFGGDSWAREARHRKRRVDDLLSASLAADPSSYRRLPNGKLACLVCPSFPVLDSPLALSLHRRAPRHAAALEHLRDRQLRARFESDKRIALSPADPPAECTVKAAPETSAGKEAGDPPDRGGEDDEGERRRRREMELRFTAAGWKRDCHGKWYRDENAEFDSDEEDPNAYFL